MEIEVVISGIISFPLKFKDTGNISIYSFLKEVGYFEVYNQVLEDDIANRLAEQPEYIDEWVGWSEDKRITSGWYIQRQDNGHYLVGYYPNSEKFTPTQYSQIIYACAALIKKEIEDVRLRHH